MMITQLKTKITNSTYIYIDTLKEPINEEKRVYAINWFNTRSLWMYNLYNFLASSQVEKVGGRAFLKAKVGNILLGDKEDFREILLIVTYPTLTDFTKLVKMPLFIIVSLFRIFSVKDFTFGFTHKKDGLQLNETTYIGDFYAIHHYRGESYIHERIQALCQEKKIKIYYLGKSVATLSTGDKETATEQTPSLLDGIVLFKADEEAVLENFLGSEAYLNITRKTQSSFIALIDRIL